MHSARVDHKQALSGFVAIPVTAFDGEDRRDQVAYRSSRRRVPTHVVAGSPPVTLRRQAHPRAPDDGWPADHRSAADAARWGVALDAGFERLVRVAGPAAPYAPGHRATGAVRRAS